MRTAFCKGCSFFLFGVSFAPCIIMMLRSKGILPPTDAYELLRCTAPANIRNPLIYCVNRYCLRSASVGAKRTSTGCSAPHVWRVPSSKALSCKHERLFDLLTLASSFDIRKTDNEYMLFYIGQIADGSL